MNPNFCHLFSQTIPPKVKTLVERCWAADPETRPEFDDVVVELENIAREISPSISQGGAGGGGGGCACAIS